MVLHYALVRYFLVLNRLHAHKQCLISQLTMSLFLPKLTCKKDIDEVIKGVAEKVLVLRFGRDEDSVCLQLDEIVSSSRA